VAGNCCLLNVGLRKKVRIVFDPFCSNFNNIPFKLKLTRDIKLKRLFKGTRTLTYTTLLYVRLHSRVHTRKYPVSFPNHIFRGNTSCKMGDFKIACDVYFLKSLCTSYDIFFQLGICRSAVSNTRPATSFINCKYCRFVIILAYF